MKELLEKRVQDEAFMKLGKKLENSYSQRCALSRLKEKEEQKLKIRQNSELKQRIINYSESLKTIIQIKPNAKKAAELKLMIENLKQPVRKRRDTKGITPASQLQCKTKEASFGHRRCPG